MTDIEAAAGETCDPVAVMVDLAGRRRVARITYKKPAEPAPTERLVEPYRLEASATATMIRCWQVAPSVEGGKAWRCFRTDRIVSAADGGSEFRPRMKITLDAGEVFDNPATAKAKAAAVPKDAYLAFLEQALLDGRFDRQEMARAREMAEGLDEGDLRVVHGTVFAAVLVEVLMDGTVTEAEERYLSSVRRALKGLGWAP